MHLEKLFLDDHEYLVHLSIHRIQFLLRYLYHTYVHLLNTLKHDVLQVQIIFHVDK